MTKQQWDRDCKARRDAEWNAAHPPDREARQHTAAIAKQSEIVFARFMARAATEKRARTAALVSHSVNGLTATMDRWNAVMGRYVLG